MANELGGGGGRRRRNVRPPRRPDAPRPEQPPGPNAALAAAIAAAAAAAAGAAASGRPPKPPRVDVFDQFKAQISKAKQKAEAEARRRKEQQRQAIERTGASRAAARRQREELTRRNQRENQLQGKIKKLQDAASTAARRAQEKAVDDYIAQGGRSEKEALSRAEQAMKNALKPFEFEFGVLGQGYRAHLIANARKDAERSERARRKQLEDRALELSAGALAGQKKTTPDKIDKHSSRAEIEAFRKKYGNTLDLDQTKGGFGTEAIKSSALRAVQALEVPFEEGINQPYSASSFARFEGGSFGDQLRAFASGLPGGTLLPFEEAENKFSRPTNSRADREVLREEGRLASFGEVISGEAADVLKADARRYLPNSFFGLGPKRPFKSRPWLEELVSGGSDLAFQIFADPLNLFAVGGKALSGPLSLAADDAAKGLRKGLTKSAKGSAKGLGISRRELKEIVSAEFDNLIQETVQARLDHTLRTTKTGLGLESTTRRIARSATDVADLERKLPGLPTTVAAKAAGADTADEAADIVSRALRTGEYAPDVSLRRQLLLKATRPGGVEGENLLASRFPGLGRRTVREADGVFDFTAKARSVANRTKGRIALTRTTRSIQAIRQGTRAALGEARVRIGDARDVISTATANLTPFERVNRLLVEIDNLPAVVQDIIEAELEHLLPSDVSPVDFSRRLNRLPPETLERLLDAETLVATATGEFGDEAAQQLLVELGVGFKKIDDINPEMVIRRAANRAGLDVGTVKRFTKYSKGNIEEVLKRLNKIENEELKLRLKGILEDIESIPGHQKRLSRLNSFNKTVRTALLDPSVADDAEALLARYGDMLTARGDLLGGGRVGLGQKLNPVRKLGKVITSLTESVAPNQVRFLSTENIELATQGRVEAIDNWMGALGLPDNARSLYRQHAAEVATENDLYRLVEDSVSMYADAQGVPPNLLVSLLDVTRGRARQMGFAVAQEGDEAGTLLREVHNLSQLNEVVPLPDPTDIRKTVTALRKAMDDPAQLEEIRQLGQLPRHQLKEVWKRTKGGLKGIHRTWKLMVVTNLYMPVVGGYVGFVGTEGDFTEKLKAGLTGTAIGALGPTRYIVRVAGIEEGLRYGLKRGFKPNEWIPLWSKKHAEKGVEYPLVSPHLLSNGDPTGMWLKGQMYRHSTGEFGALDLDDASGVLAKVFRKDRRFIDAWHRHVNFQVNEFNGPVDKILLAQKAGRMTDAEASRLLKEFLNTAEGKVYWNRWKGAFGAPKNPQEAIARQRKLIDDYFTEEMALMRQPEFGADFQDIPRSYLKNQVKQGNGPNFVVTEKTWVLPRGRTVFSDIGAARDKMLDQLIFGGPTRTLQRNRMARHIHHDEYLRLVNQGMDPKRAQELADQRAINEVNTIMFNMTNESRFASKIDFIFPFQQPREELVRVWAPLLFNNKVRSLKLTRLGARALENGVSQGIFYEYTNPYTGDKEMRMKVPGSAALSRALGGVNAHFSSELKDFLFLTQAEGMGGLGVPSVGGPFWSTFSRTFFNHFPEFYDSMPEALRDYLFPFGVSGRLGRAEPNRLWMAFMGTPAPWEFANEFEQQDEYRKVQQEIWLSLYASKNKGKNRVDWVDPTDEEVDEAVKAYFQTQAYVGAIWPASTRFIQPYAEMIENAKKPYTNKVTGEFDYLGFINDHPHLQPFVSTRGEFVGPDTLDNWTRSEKEKSNDYVKHWKERFTLKEWKAQLEEWRLTNEAYTERYQIPFNYADWELSDAYDAWEGKWLEKLPSVVETSRNNAFRDRDLNRILLMSDGEYKDRALDKWRKKYDVSFTSYGFIKRKLEKEGFEWDHWAVARPLDVVQDEVKKLTRKGLSDEEALRGFNPAEQFKYWNAKRHDLDYFEGAYSDDNEKRRTYAADIVNQYYLYGQRISDLFKRFPQLSNTDDFAKGTVTSYIDQWEGSYYEGVDAIYEEIGVVSEAYDKLRGVKGKGAWQERQALFQKRSALYDQVKALKNKQYKEMPGILDYFRDVEGAMWLLRDGKRTRAFNMAMDALSQRGLGQGGFLPSNEQMTYLRMPAEVREAYVGKLTAQLDTPDGEDGKLFWEWLTDFQQELLTRNAPPAALKDWIDQHPSNQRPGSGWRNFRWRSFRRGRGYYNNYFLEWGSPEQIARDELEFAYTQFGKYNKRPEGATPPKGWDEYLALPRDPIVRNDFLDNHPKVAEWIRLGPMSNMPEYLRYIVANIMIKHGDWTGELRSDMEITDLSFAKEQLKRWNRRGKMERPLAYQKWLNMPTGVAKAKFLEDNPDLQEWLKLGPMSQMPDAYQDVIRDIMVRYGEWTQQTDGLGLVIQGYYKVPSYAREQYLEDHPELVAYWNALRTPEEKKMAEKVDQYFSIQDPNARQMFMIMHPEVSEWFIERRTKRYEEFLDRVAAYMGNNPKMFTHYLERQEDVMKDLLLRYAEPTLIREVPMLTDATTSKRSRIRG